MYRRLLGPLLDEALSDRPVVLLHGARQTGKTTLVRGIADDQPDMRYVTLDDAAVMAAADADPDGFVAGLAGPVVIDEVQRVPALLRAIKGAVDRDRRPGRFLLTGSSDVLALPRASESLAGRMEVQQLRPLAQAEIEGAKGTFVDALFEKNLPRTRLPPGDRADVASRIVRGGFPEALDAANDRRRRAWHASYLTTVLSRDVRDLANVEGLSQLPRLLTMVATRTMGLLSYSDLGRNLAMPQTTLKRYFALLEATFLVSLVPAWSTHSASRLVKAPKVLLTDTGLAAHLLGFDGATLGASAADASPGTGESFGSLLEGFVAAELQRLAAWSEHVPSIFHLRAHAGQEVDLVLEDRRRRVIGIEVKASASPTAADFKGLRALADLASRRFLRGIVLYLGRDIVPFAPNLHAVPVTALWRW